MKRIVLVLFAASVTLTSYSQKMEWIGLSKVDDEQGDSIVINYMNIEFSGDTAYVSYHITCYEPVEKYDDFGFKFISGYSKKVYEKNRVKFKKIIDHADLVALRRVTDGFYTEEIRIFKDRCVLSVFIYCDRKYLSLGAFNYNKDNFNLLYLN